jgi:hypothetical protein
MPFDDAITRGTLWIVGSIGPNGTLDLVNLALGIAVPLRKEHLSSRFMIAGKLNDDGLTHLQGYLLRPKETMADDGATLAFVEHMRLRRTGIPMPAAIDCLYPYGTDLQVIRYAERWCLLPVDEEVSPADPPPPFIPDKYSNTNYFVQVWP